MLPATLRDSCMCLSLDSRALDFCRRMASLRVGENLLRLRRAERYGHSPGCLVLFFADARARPAGALWQVWMLVELSWQLFSRCCVLEFKRGVSLPAGCEGCELRVCRVWAWSMDSRGRGAARAGGALRTLPHGAFLSGRRRLPPRYLPPT